jgi:Rad3-related DNA helicase
MECHILDHLPQQIKNIIIDVFPFETPNPGQIDAIEFAVLNILNGKRHVILELCTGVGKSAVAQTIHETLYRLNPKHRTSIVTATRGLQNQYVESVANIYDLKGKQNYVCPIGNDFYGAPKCKKACGSKACNPAEQCTYVKRRNTWLKDSSFRLTNNAFFCKAPEEFIASTDHKSDLTIIDESHELETSILDAATIDLDLTTITSNIQQTNMMYGEPIAELTAGLYAMYKTSPFHTTPELKELIRDYLKGPRAYMHSLKDKIDSGDTSYETEYDTVSEIVESFSRLVLSDESEWMITEYTKLKSIVIKPIYAATVANSVVYSKANQFVHMSATICGAEEYAKTLGLPDGTWAYFGADNPIPVENRKINIIKGFNIGRNFSDWDRYYKLIDMLMTKHKDERGVVHSVSFKLANDILENLSKENAKRVLVSGNTTDIMNHMRDTPNGIVISPSIEKGYDFKGDLSRFQIIAKIPFGYLGDPHIKLNTERNSKWYARSTVLRLIQACGRSVRGPSDWATTYIIDENIIKLVGRNTELFPDYFLEAINVLGK